MKTGNGERGKKVYLDVLLSITCKNDVKKWGESDWDTAISEELSSRQENYKNTDILDLLKFYMYYMDTDDIERMVMYGITWAIAFDIVANNEIKEMPRLLDAARE